MTEENRRSTDHISPDDQADLSAVPPKFSKTNKQDLVIFHGPPGAGKSTFYWKHLEPLGYERVNQDLLKTVRSLFTLHPALPSFVEQS